MTGFPLVAALALTSASLLSVSAARADDSRVQPALNPSPQQIQASQAEARQLSDAFVAVAEKVSPSVVQIEVTAREQRDDLLSLMRGGDTPIQHETGSGVVFTPDGNILTNNHVVDGALTINVRLRDGRYLPAKLVGRDPSSDLAVVKIDAGNTLVAARFADSDQARVGEWVVAIGSPFGLGYTVTTGVLSAKGRNGLGMNAVEDYLQTDASINPGNSGGPLCDLNGNVLGINSMIVGHGAGIGFAIPSDMARRAAEQILRTGKVERSWLGVGMQDLSPEIAALMHLDTRAGTLINTVADGGPGAKANIRPGDVISQVAGHPVHERGELLREIIRHDVGQTIDVEILRGGNKYTAKVTLVARPEPPVPPLPVQQPTAPHAGLGLTVRELSAQQAQSMGLPPKPLTQVTAILPGSSADRASIKPGDVIIEADGVDSPTASQLQRAAEDGALLLRLRRRDQSFYAGIKR
jgi:S1-C subfamily serine protease